MELHICTSVRTGTSSTKRRENRDSVCVTRSQLGPHGHVHRSPAQSRTRAPNGSGSRLGDGRRNAGRGARKGDRQGKETRKQPLGHQAGPLSLSRADPTGAVGVRAPPWSKGTGVCIPKPRLLLVEGCFWAGPALTQVAARLILRGPRGAEGNASGSRTCLMQPRPHQVPDPLVSVLDPWDPGTRGLEGSEAQCVFQATSGCM